MTDAITTLRSDLCNIIAAAAPGAVALDTVDSMVARLLELDDVSAHVATHAALAWKLYELRKYECAYDLGAAVCRIESSNILLQRTALYFSAVHRRQLEAVDEADNLDYLRQVADVRLAPILRKVSSDAIREVFHPVVALQIALFRFVRDVRQQLSEILERRHDGAAAIRSDAIRQLVRDLMTFDEAEAHRDFYHDLPRRLLDAGEPGPALELACRLHAANNDPGYVRVIARCLSLDASQIDTAVLLQQAARYLVNLKCHGLEPIGGPGGTDAVDRTTDPVIASLLSRADPILVSQVFVPAAAAERRSRRTTMQIRGEIKLALDALERGGDTLPAIEGAVTGLLARGDIHLRPTFYSAVARRLLDAGKASLAYRVAGQLYRATGDQAHLRLVAKAFLGLDRKPSVPRTSRWSRDELRGLGDPLLDQVLARAPDDDAERIFLRTINAGLPGATKKAADKAFDRLPGATPLLQALLDGESLEEERESYRAHMRHFAVAPARAALREFLKKWPADFDARINLARINVHEVDYEDALANVGIALEAQPDSIVAMTIIFQIYRLRLQSREALQHLAGLAESGRFSDAQLAKFAEVSGQLPEAQRLYSEHHTRHPGDAASATAYVQFLHKLGALEDLDAFLGQAKPSFLERPRVAAAKSYLDDIRTLCRAPTGPGKLDTLGAGNTRLINEICSRAAEWRPAGPVARGPKPLRVAIAIGSLGPGGAERQCATLCAALSQQCTELGIGELRLFVHNMDRSARDSFYLPQIQEAGVEVTAAYDRGVTLRPEDFGVDHGHREFASLLAMLQPTSRGQRYLQFARHLIDYRPDVLYGWLDETIIQCGTVSAALPEVQVVGRWGSMPPGMQRDVTPQRQIEAEQMRDAYRIIGHHLPGARFFANARETAVTYEDWLGWEGGRVGTIYNGYNFSSMEPSYDARASIRSQLGIGDDECVFGTVFRMSEEKRPFLWLEIARAIAARAQRKCSFILVGDGPLMPQVKAAAAGMPEISVHIVGRQTDVGAWYQAMDVFLLTSSVEGMSNALLEAQYFQRPIVCFNVGGLGEAVLDSETGFLVEEGDTATFIERGAALANDADHLRAVGAAGRDFVTRHFSLESLIRNTVRNFA